MRRVISILLVEDDTLDQIEAQRTLDRRGILYRLTVAKNGEEAVRALAEDTHGLPDIILLDLNMPKMNGFEFARVVRGNPQWKDIKIFILTTADGPNDKETANEIGVSGFITKPLKLDSPSSIDAYNLMIDLMNM
jgi:CheY-like chemotaxis protein